MTRGITGKVESPLNNGEKEDIKGSAYVVYPVLPDALLSYLEKKTTNCREEGNGLSIFEREGLTERSQQG